MRTINAERDRLELAETHAQVDEPLANAADKAGFDVALVRTPQAKGSQVRGGHFAGDRTVMWSRRFYAEAWLVPLFKLLTAKHFRGASYVHADLRLAKKHQRAYEAAWRLGGEAAVLELRAQLVSGALHGKR